MQYIEINGNRKLCGDIKLHGAKNSILPILAGAVLVKGSSTLHSVPKLSDVTACEKIISHLGGKTERRGDVLVADTTDINNCEIPRGLMEELRSSIIFLGSVSARCGSASMYLPGGCKIGARPIDIHIRALQTLGYKVTFDGDYIRCEKGSAKGASVTLPFPSVGATENAILAAVTLEGTTTVINAAREPEIIDLADYLNSAGAKISGAGNSVIEIEGVKRLTSTEHTVIPDRILASTLMSAVAAAGGSAVIKNVNLSHLAPVIPVFEEAGCRMTVKKNVLSIASPRRIRAVKSITTGVYPSFPTDSQAPVMAALCTARGSSVIRETIFENRLRHVPELCRFGADIIVSDSTAIVRGRRNLHGARADCTDLRGGAAVVIAALAAEGKSEIYNIHHIDRGYESIEYQMQSLGADIRRVNDEEGQ